MTDRMACLSVVHVGRELKAGVVGESITRATLCDWPRALEALLRPAALFIVLLLMATRVFADHVTLASDPVASPVLAGYMLHYGPSAGNYTFRIDVGNMTTRAVSDLTAGATYHFAVIGADGIDNQLRTVRTKYDLTSQKLAQPQHRRTR